MGTGALSPGVKEPVYKADHSPPTSSEVKKTWLYTSTPPHAFMAYRYVMHRNNFSFYNGIFSNHNEELHNLYSSPSIIKIIK
jgi:hypothetical protein